MIIKNAHIITMEDIDYENGYIVFDSKIQAIGNMDSYNKEWENEHETYNAEGGYVAPGFVEAHCHIGIFEDGIGFEGDDGNEETDPCTPHLRGVDAVNPFDNSFKEALQGGVTTVVTGPGSANPISGQLLAMKTGTKGGCPCVDDMLVAAPIGMKFSFGENPKTVYHGKNQAPNTRMAIAAIIRENLFKAKEYMEAKNKYDENPDENDCPDFDIKMEALLPILNKEIKMHAHAHRADDICTSVRIAKEFDLDLVIVHGTESHLIKDVLKDNNISVLLGPTLSDRSKPELKNLTFDTSKILYESGILFSIITDHPVIPIKYMSICAELCIKNGLNKNEALKAMTINPARILGLDNRIGSIKCGKDADILIFDGYPLDFNSTIKKVILGGFVEIA